MAAFADAPPLLDRWYVVATTDEIAGDPRAVTVLGRGFVLWRDGDDVVRAAVDRCPHREAPLSCGSLTGGELRCAYHGWRFAGDGRCTAIPSADPDTPVPARAHLDTIGATERYGLVWLCPGEPADTIPRITHDDDPAFRRLTTEVEVWDVSAPRMTDNFMDISHFPWVHTATFGAGQPQRVPPLSSGPLEDGWYGYAYEVDADNPAEAAAASGSDEPVVHRWMSTAFSLPFNVRSTIRYTDGLEHVLLLATTPVDDLRSLFTFVVWRNDDPAVDPAPILAFDRAIGAEDRAMLERIPGLLPLEPGMLVDASADRPSVAWRRAFAELLAGS